MWLVNVRNGPFIFDGKIKLHHRYTLKMVQKRCFDVEFVLGKNQYLSDVITSCRQVNILRGSRHQNEISSIQM